MNKIVKKLNNYLTEDILDYPKKENTYMAGISFKQKPNATQYPDFILNWKQDGWFRRDFGVPGAGYGLMIRDIKRIVKSIEWPTVIRYSAMLTYWPSKYDDTEFDNAKSGQWETESVYLYVNKKIKVDDVVKYIQANKSKWVP